jgi:hypothetical protein
MLIAAEISIGCSRRTSGKGDYESIKQIKKKSSKLGVEFTTYNLDFC